MQTIAKWLLQVTIFVLTTSSFASEIPPDFGKSRIEAKGCECFLRDCRSLFTGLNQPASFRLARLAWFTRTGNRPKNAHEIPRRAQHPFDAVHDGYGVSELYEPIENLTFQVYGKGKRMTVQASVEDLFFGKIAQSYSVKQWNLKFLLEGKDPTAADLPLLRFLTDRVLEDFRSQRREQFFLILNKVANVIQATVTRGTTVGPEQVPYIRLNYTNTDGAEFNVYVGFLAMWMEFVVESKIQNSRFVQGGFVQPYLKYMSWDTRQKPFSASSPEDFSLRALLRQAVPVRSQPLWYDRIPQG